MVKISPIRITKLSACIALSAWVFCGRSVLADDSAMPTVTLMAVASSQISVGEPVVIHYKIENPSTIEQVTFHAGLQDDQWYTLTLSSQGSVIARSLKPVPEKPQGFALSPERSILPGGSFSGDIVVGQTLGAPKPGRYVLTVHLDLPFYAESPGGATRFYTNGAAPDPPTGIIRQDFDFPLTVTPSNPAKLRIMAEGLEKLLLNTKNVASCQFLTKQLFALPEAQALPSWKALIADPNTSQTVLYASVTQLGFLKTAAAADLLVQMQHRPATEWGAAPHVDGVLAEMYNTGTPALRQHIKKLAAAQGATLGSKIDGLSNPN